MDPRQTLTDRWRTIDQRPTLLSATSSSGITGMGKETIVFAALQPAVSALMFLGDARRLPSFSPVGAKGQPQDYRFNTGRTTAWATDHGPQSAWRAIEYSKKGDDAQVNPARAYRGHDLAYANRSLGRRKPRTHRLQRHVHSPVRPSRIGRRAYRFGLPGAGV